MTVTTPTRTRFSRLQLALNVTDIDEAVDFYTKLFGTAPHKRRPGYANFAIADPPLKLVLFENDREQRLNHLGVEVGTVEQVGEATERIRTAGLPSEIQDQTTCCFAQQDKVWTTDPDGERWEFYTILDDDPDHLGLVAPTTGEDVSRCCL